MDVRVGLSVSAFRLGSFLLNLEGRQGEHAPFWGVFHFPPLSWLILFHAPLSAKPRRQRISFQKTRWTCCTRPTTCQALKLRSWLGVRSKGSGALMGLSQNGAFCLFRLFFCGVLERSYVRNTLVGGFPYQIPPTKWKRPILGFPCRASAKQHARRVGCRIKRPTICFMERQGFSCFMAMTHPWTHFRIPEATFGLLEAGLQLDYL